MMLPNGPTLHDIHMPPTPSWWPLAPGWWILIGLALVLAGYAAWRVWRRRLPKRRWRAASHELDALLADHGDDAATFAAGVSQLLRRVARLRDPATAGLRGAAWHGALQSMAGGRVAVEPLVALEQGKYQRHVDIDTTMVTDAARQWLRRVLLHGSRHA